MDSREQSAARSDTMPRIDFTTFILSVSSAAYMGLGFSAERGAPGDVDLELARQNIDLLELMALKTHGNLSAEEDRLLQQLLFETRMRFIEVEKRLSVPTASRGPSK